jgi:hypothetical protein
MPVPARISTGDKPARKCASLMKFRVTIRWPRGDSDEASAVRQHRRQRSSGVQAAGMQVGLDLAVGKRSEATTCLYLCDHSKEWPRELSRRELAGQPRRQKKHTNNSWLNREALRR